MSFLSQRIMLLFSVRG